MWLDDLPHERLEFEHRVRDVEDRQQPRVPVTREGEIFFHAGDFGIATRRSVFFFSVSYVADDEPNVTPVKESK